MVIDSDTKNRTMVIHVHNHIQHGIALTERV